MNEQSTTAMSEYAILYVDDEEMALKYFSRALGREYTVHTAVDSHTGLDILAQHGDTIGLLVSDQRMPTESGVELLKKVRNRWPHIVRILTTAYADLEDAIEAVNRGEIFRYITKPWDIATLRTEIGQAMELFQLRHERTRLMREKMNVWQRLLQLGRLRDLVVMGGSFTHLRHSPQAIAQYLADHLSASTTDNQITPGHLDLWQATVAEIRQTLAFADNITSSTVGITNSDDAFATTLDADALQDLVKHTFHRFDCPDGTGFPAIRVAREPAAIMLRELAAAIGDTMTRATLQPAGTDGGVRLSLSTTTKPAVAGLTSAQATGLLTAYLLAFHHGGKLALETADGHYRYVMTLPANPAATALAPLQPGWLEPLLVRLEGWD